MENPSERFVQPFSTIRIVSKDAKNSWSKDQPEPKMEKTEEPGYNDKPSESESS